MLYNTYQEAMLEPMAELWKEEAERICYKAYKNEAEWKRELVENLNFKPEGCILAWASSSVLAGFAIAISQEEFLPGQNHDNTPGYLYLLVVRKEYEGRGIGSELLLRAEDFLRQVGKKEIRISHKCPVKMSWYINWQGHEHNKAPGIKVDTRGYAFFMKRGFEAVQNEVSYDLSLAAFVIPRDIKQHMETLDQEGIRITWFDQAKDHGYEEMFLRLQDESFLKKFRQGIQEGRQMLVAKTLGGQVVGTVGAVYPEENGRGFFSALAVDPLFGGKGIGKALFYRLCEELKQMGAQYMTIFVTKTNFARKIYEEAGFLPVQEWAIIRKSLR